MNETNADGPTDGEQILWNQLAERDEVNAQLRAEVERLKAMPKALAEGLALSGQVAVKCPNCGTWLAETSAKLATAESEVERLKTQLAEREEDRALLVNAAGTYRARVLMSSIAQADYHADQTPESAERVSEASSLEADALDQLDAAIRAARAQEDGK